MIFLYKITISIPIANSNPAIPSIKKDTPSVVISQYIALNNNAIVYNVIQINSDRSNIEIKFLGLKAIIIIVNQKIKDQNNNHVNI